MSRSSEIRDIQGYYYDKEKKKYFKIQATGPSNSAYSSRDIKRRKTEEEQAEALSSDATRRRAQIRKSKLLGTPLEGGILRREHGLRHLDVASNIVAGGLVQQGGLRCPPQFLHCGAPIFTIEHRLDLGPSIADFRIAYDHQLLTVRGNTNKDEGSLKHGGFKICHNESIYNANRSLETFNNPGASTSMSIHAADRKVVMTWLSGSPDSGIGITNMHGIDRDNEPERPCIQLGPGRSRDADVSIYSSAPAPPSSPLLFAIGSSHGILAINKQDCNTNWVSPRPTDWDNHPKDTFAVEFLSNIPSVFLSGGRRGILHITDLRIPVFGAHADTISHPSSITHIKQIDDHRILVAGLESSLCQYDLRFRKSASVPLSSELNFRNAPNRSPTVSILQYPEYKNESVIPIGFDVDIESGIIAAGKEGAPHMPAAVQLLSLHSGQLLKTIVGGGSGGRQDVLGQNRVGGWVNCIRFAQDIEHRAKSLYWESSHNIVRFAWVNKEDGDI